VIVPDNDNDKRLYGKLGGTDYCRAVMAIRLFRVCNFSVVLCRPEHRAIRNPPHE